MQDDEELARQTDLEQREHDLTLYGIAFQYRAGHQKYWLRPDKVTVYRKDSKVETPSTVKDSIIKRFVRFILDPARFVIGIVFSLLGSQLSGNHQVTDGRFLYWFTIWYISAVILFVVKELLRWAALPPKSE